MGLDDQEMRRERRLMLAIEQKMFVDDDGANKFASGELTSADDVEDFMADDDVDAEETISEGNLQANQLSEKGAATSSNRPASSAIVEGGGLDAARGFREISDSEAAVSAAVNDIDVQERGHGDRSTRIGQSTGGSVDMVRENVVRQPPHLDNQSEGGTPVLSTRLPAAMAGDDGRGPAREDLVVTHAPYSKPPNPSADSPAHLPATTPPVSHFSANASFA